MNVCLDGGVCKPIKGLMECVRLCVGHLNQIAKRAFLDNLVERGYGQWITTLSGRNVTVKEKKKCLVLWKSLEEWADALLKWHDGAFGGGACNMLLSDFREGHDAVVDTEVENLPDEILIPAIEKLQKKGKAKCVWYCASGGLVGRCHVTLLCVYCSGCTDWILVGDFALNFNDIKLF